MLYCGLGVAMLSSYLRVSDEAKDFSQGKRDRKDEVIGN
jgi:hypothetical protein